MNTINIKALSEQVARIDGSTSSLQGRVTTLESRIPKDYSTTETNTGVKYYGKDVYCKYVYGDISDTPGSFTIGDIGVGSEIVWYFFGIYKLISTYTAHSTTTLYQRNNGELAFDLPSGSTFLSGKYHALVYYTKATSPSRTTEDDEPETKSTKATKRKATK